MRATRRTQQREREEAVEVPEDDIFVLDTAGSRAARSDENGTQKKSAKKKKKKRTKGPAVDAAHEAEWERMLFGADASTIFAEDDEDKDRTNTGAHAHGSDAGASEDESAEPGIKRKKGTAAWHDEDDEDVRIDLIGRDRLRKLRKSEDEDAVSGVEFIERVREQAIKMSQNVSWATRRKTDLSDRDGESLLRSGAALSGHRSAMLPAAALEVERLKDANARDASDSVVQTVRFHPNSQLLLTASLDKRLKFFQIDGKNNAKVQGVHFEDLPIQYAEFSGDGEEVLVSGRRKFFYIYNLARASISKVEGVLGSTDKYLGAMIPSPDCKWIASLGTCGHVGLLSGRSKQWVGEVKMNCDVTCAAFARDGVSLYTAGKSPLVYQWDLRMRRCVRKIHDDGSLHVTSLAISNASSAVLAVGSKTGVVNSYDMAAFASLPVGDFGEIRPVTRRAVMNLTSGVSRLDFNHDGQMLLMASQAKKEALRIMHTSSCTVFPNWPTASTPLHSVSTSAFSPDNRLLAIGNDRGKVLLYRLKHYQ